MDAKELLKAELSKRTKSNRSARDELKAMIGEQRKIAEMDPSFRTSLAPTASMLNTIIDDPRQRLDTNQFQQPESTQDALRKALNYRMQLPQESISGLPAAISRLQKAEGDGGLRQLSANDVMKVQEGENVPMMLNDVANVISDNADIFGPVKGRAFSLNPYSTQGRTVDAQIRAASQAFGRYMEGGVLRKEDEEKYRKMFPNLSDTPAIAANKLEVVNRLLQQRQSGNVQALGRAGFDVSAFNGGVSSMQTPQVNTSGSVDPSQMSDEELDAMIKRLSKGM